LKVSLRQRANEVSRRYVDDTPEFSTIPVWRVCEGTRVQQGSTGTAHTLIQRSLTHMQRRGIPKTIQAYLYAKESHRAPEQARALLPPSMYTQFSLRGMLQRGMPCIAFRSAPEVQYATRLITSLSASSIARCFPSLAPSSLRCNWSVVEG
jgi:thymidylate synthase (FAD)